MVAGALGLEELRFPKKQEKIPLNPQWKYDIDFFAEIIDQLTEYFAGKRRSFNLKLNLSGTPFQKKVWQQLQDVPFGSTTSYGEIAKRMNNPKACRAVGGANNKNPIPIIIPCHRIIGKDGSLTGFGGGLELKEFLRHHEQSH